MNARPTVVLSALAGILVVALVVTTTLAVLQTRRLSAQEEEVERLRAEVTALRDQVERLEADRDSDPGAGLDGLLDGDIGDLLDGLLDGDGDLGGLLDGLLSGASGDIPGLRCMTPEGGGLGDLFGDLGGMLGGGSSSEPDLDPDELVDVIADQVAALRELDFTGDVEVAFLDDDALTAEIEQILDDEIDVDELTAQADVLAALRAIPTDADLEELTRELLTGQVAGFYSPEEERLVVRTPDGDTLRVMDRITLAHELDHALVDQAIGLPDLDDDGIDADASLARLAVIEGDATLLMNRWTLEHLSLADQLAIAGSPDLLLQQQQLDAFPHYLGRELLFPYTAGLDLVCDRWIEAGWGGVDAAYASPPTTTAGVLFPDRWDDDAVAAPSLDAPSGASERLADTFGAAPLLWLFEAPGGDTDAALSDPLARAAAWAGGEVRLWDHDGEPVVGLALTGQATGGPDLCTSVTDWYAASAPGATRVGDGAEVRFVDEVSAAAIHCDGEAVRLAVASDVAVAAAVVGSR